MSTRVFGLTLGMTAIGLGCAGRSDNSCWRIDADGTCSDGTSAAFVLKDGGAASSAGLADATAPRGSSLGAGSSRRAGVRARADVVKGAAEAPSAEGPRGPGAVDGHAGPSGAAGATGASAAGEPSVVPAVVEALGAVPGAGRARATGATGSVGPTEAGRIEVQGGPAGPTAQDASSSGATTGATGSQGAVVGPAVDGGGPAIADTAAWTDAGADGGGAAIADTALRTEAAVDGGGASIADTAVQTDAAADAGPASSAEPSAPTGATGAVGAAGSAGATTESAISPTIARTFQSASSVGGSDSVTLSIEVAADEASPIAFRWSATGGTLAPPVESSTSSQVVWTPPAAAASSWSITATALGNGNTTSTKTFTVRPASCFGATAAPPPAWSWGIMADTQWTTTDDGRNPNSVAVDIINQVNSQFIAKGVKFVVAVGDMTDNGSNAALDVRAEFAQALYNANIGFYPLRGNHEPSAVAAKEFLRVFPQTQTGMHNNTPADCVFPSRTHSDDSNTNPVANATGIPFLVGSLAPAPTGDLAPLAGLSYAFDYGDSRFVLLDQFTPPTGAAIPIASQQPWVSATLAARASTGHAFVLGHKGILGQYHSDTLLGDDPAQATVVAARDAWITTLQTKGVRYFIGGHDHLHNRAIIATSDGTTARVQNIIASSDSSKFYTPTKKSPGDAVRARETPISQELNTVGFYVVTIEGIKATVDFYSADPSGSSSFSNGLLSATPRLHFTKHESFGYGLNGKQFVIGQGGSYAVVQDGYQGTTMQILAGTNGNTNLEAGGRALSKTVDTGWSAATCMTASAVLSLWTTASALGSDQTDTYALAMSYDPTAIAVAQVSNGSFGLAAKDASGRWVNAVTRDFGGAARFVQRAWQPTDALGTYGIDSATHTAWAVLNYGVSDFAVASFSGSD